MTGLEPDDQPAGALNTVIQNVTVLENTTEQTFVLLNS